VRHQAFHNSRRRDFDVETYHAQPRSFGTRSRFSEPRFEAPSGPPVQGVVKWFSPEKGFGRAAGKPKVSPLSDAGDPSQRINREYLELNYQCKCEFHLIRINWVQYRGGCDGRRGRDPGVQAPEPANHEAVFGR